MAIFKGEGRVRWKDRVIAVFPQEGWLETNDEMVIQRLRLRGFKELASRPLAKAEQPKTEPEAPKADEQPKPKRTIFKRGKS